MCSTKNRVVLIKKRKEKKNRVIDEVFDRLLKFM